MMSDIILYRPLSAYIDRLSLKTFSSQRKGKYVMFTEAAKHVAFQDSIINDIAFYIILLSTLNIDIVTRA